MKHDDFEVLIWFVGFICLVTGCAFAWGWIGGLICAGVILCGWPLLKQFAK